MGNPPVAAEAEQKGDRWRQHDPHITDAACEICAANKAHERKVERRLIEERREREERIKFRRGEYATVEQFLAEREDSQLSTGVDAREARYTAGFGRTETGCRWVSCRKVGY